MSDPRVTAIFVGGAMEERYYDEVDTARRLYPQGTVITAFMPRQIAGTFTFSPFTYEAFFNFAPTLIGQAAPDGILHFVQFGHGGGGAAPTLITQDGDISGTLDNVFEEAIRDHGSPAYTAIILGGCYSGGFGRWFLGSDTFTPDFFFGTSPLFTVAASGLTHFFGATIDSTDHNHDGVLTLRERAVYAMQSGNALAIMFARAGSADIDMQGRPATAPYFPKEVEDLASHGDLISMMENLRFGEQAVVYIEGEEEDSELRAWFENEAENGDGFYKFVSIPDSEESRSFFETGGRPAVFVIGPNLRYTGVPLTSDRPVGEQIPEIIADENPLMVIVGWKEKIDNAVGADYLATITRGVYFDYDVTFLASLGSPPEVRR